VPLRIDARYCGPPSSANGGVTCGLLSAHVDAPVVEVTLRRPPPLDTDLRVEDGALYDGELLVAAAVPGNVDVEPPAPVSVAVAAATPYAGQVEHPFPGCFVCGPANLHGLQLQPGPVAPGVVAAVWTPRSDEDFLLWAAMDCPGGWASDLIGRPMVLGRMTLRRDARPTVGEPHVVMGWTIGTDGRKTFSGTALYDQDEKLLALAQQTWFAVDLSTF
jgi:hypothetical protein